MAVLLALIAAGAYGLGDFLGGLASRRYPPMALMARSYTVSTLLVLLAMPWLEHHFSLPALLYSAGSGVALVVAIVCLYSALAIGPISIVSPITALLSAGLPVVVGLLLGEALSLAGWGGVLLGMAAIVLVGLHGEAPEAQPNRTRFAGKVVVLTVLTGVGFALSYVLTHAIPADAGMWPVLVARVVGWLVILLVLGPGMLRGGSRELWLYAVPIGALDALAGTAMYLTLQQSQLSTSTVLMSLYPVFTILMALLVLRERLTLLQGLGIGLSLLAVMLMSF